MILLAEEADGRLLGIAPLMYSIHTMFGLRWGKIEFIGTPQTDYNDFILMEREKECLKLFFHYLEMSSNRWGCIDLSDIPEGSKSLQYLSGVAKAVKPFHKCPCTMLPRSHSEFLYSLKRKHRRELQRNLRRLEEDFNVEFTDCSESSNLNQEMNIFFDLHQKRWQSQGCSGVFLNQKVRHFHLDVAKSFSQKDQLGLFILKLSGVPAAALYGFRYNGKYYAYLSGFDPRFFSYSVGSLLFSYAIDNCIKNGFLEFDFMRGAEEYKDRWNTTVHWNQQAILTKPGKFANLKHRLYSEYWNQGRKVKYHLRIDR